MNDLQNIFDKLYDIDTEWDMVERINDISENVWESFFDCIMKCRQLVKVEGIKEVKSIVAKEIRNKNFQNNIIGFIEYTMRYYNSMKTVRNLAEKDKILVQSLIRDIFENQIIRYDMEFLDSYKQYKLKSKEEFEDIVETLLSLTKYYIKTRISQKDIIKDFIDETGLDEKIATVFAQYIDNHYRELQMMVIMEKLEELDERVRELE